MSGRCFFPRWEKRNLVNLRKTKEKKKSGGRPSFPACGFYSRSLAGRPPCTASSLPGRDQQVTLAGGLLVFVILKQGLTVQLCVAWPILSRPG